MKAAMLDERWRVTLFLLLAPTLLQRSAGQASSAPASPPCSAANSYFGGAACLTDGGQSVFISSIDGATGVTVAVDISCACGAVTAAPDGTNQCNCPGINMTAGRRLQEIVFQERSRRQLQQSVPEPVPGVNCPASLQASASVPWNLDRINQRALPLDHAYSWNDTGLGVNVYIISTGIRASHEDFVGSDGNSRVLEGYNPYGGTSLVDSLGYGTLAAGIVGGKTYGVAKNATMYSVKVFGTSAAVNLTAILMATDWVRQHAVKPAVVVWLTYGAPDAGKTAAVQYLYSAGLPVIVGAGTTAGDACQESPAMVPQAFTTGGTTITDTMTSGSSFGSCIKLMAPSDNIAGPSCQSDTGTWVSSNSNNAPAHSAGYAARMLETAPTLTPPEVYARLTATATSKALNASTLSGSPNLLLYTGGFAPACPAYAATTSRSEFGVATGGYTASCTQPDGSLTTNATQALYVQFTLYPSNALDLQLITPADFMLDNPAAQVVSFAPLDSSDPTCGGISVHVVLPQDDSYIYNATQVCFSIPGGHLKDNCYVAFPATQACYAIANCPSACLYAANMAYPGTSLPSTIDASALLAFAASAPLTGVTQNSFTVYGPATSSVTVVNEQTAPTFYFVSVAVPESYYGPVTIAYSGTATDSHGNQLAAVTPVSYNRTHADALASSVVFELVPPTSGAM